MSIVRDRGKVIKNIKIAKPAHPKNLLGFKCTGFPGNWSPWDGNQNKIYS